MECKDDGQKTGLPSTNGRHKVRRKRRAGDAGRVQLALATSVPYPFPTHPMHLNQVPNYAANHSIKIKYPVQNLPFMNNMDEISYWVFTKRAPCLLNYDNLGKRTEEQAHCSKAGPTSVPSEQPTPKKRRKLKLLDDESVSSEKQQNVFFETHRQQNNKGGKKSCRSESLSSNIDFNIKGPVKVKPKSQRRGKVATKGNKVITSTPKVTNLRRSLRKKQQCNNNISHLNHSLDIFDSSAINGNPNPHEIKSEDVKEIVSEKKKDVTLNGRTQFEDESDVSGFTANYIRSTKLLSSKVTPKSRSKTGKALLKDRKNNSTEKEKMVVCINKSTNTGISKAVLNCSTDSSQNIINLVTVKNNDISNKVDKSTSLLKFIETKDNQECISDKKTNTTRCKNNLNVSFQSKSSGASRYPKRCKNVSLLNSDDDCNKNKKSKTVTKTPKRRSKIDHLENTVDSLISRTRSGKKIGLETDLEMSGCQAVQVTNSTEPISSSVAINVATCSDKNHKRLRSSLRRPCKSLNKKQLKKRSSESETSDKKFDGEPQDSVVKRLTRSGRSRKCSNKARQSLQRDSLRDKSGFAACFSDSDSDNAPLQQRKFFC